MKVTDLSHLKVVTLSDIDAAVRESATEVRIAPGAILTPSAREALAEKRLAVGSGSPVPDAAATGVDPARLALFHSPEAEAVKEEICAVGRKLWMRQFVDGNGGNISYRLGANEVICTPTLISKYDLRPQDMCLVDLEGNQLAGGKPRTSEILMHMEIYKEVPEAKSVVHCHPPHATAYAITGKVPPTCIIPEFDVFIGKIAVSPYETPGTPAFARTVIPFVKTHNTILLSNHGIVCWADTVTHAEWLVEILENYCKTYLIAQQIGKPLAFLPDEKIQEILALKRRMGLPDSRMVQLEPHE